jgi:pterin-4a-carbinolamine dehydratase
MLAKNMGDVARTQDTVKHGPRFENEYHEVAVCRENGEAEYYSP